MASRSTLTVLACAGALALAPGVAHASIASIDGNGFVEARGEPGEVNDMTTRPGEDGVILSDSAGIRTTDPACRSLSPTEVTCSGDGGLLYGEDGNDTLRDGGMPNEFRAEGGPGDDTIVAGSTDAIVYGDAPTVRATDGDDTIVGSSSTRPLNPDVPGDAGNDTLLGGAGDDIAQAVRGSDLADGGEGNDWLIGTDTDIAVDDGNSDTLACGAGTDRVSIGDKDKVRVGCETLEARLYCTGVKTCKATGTLTGKAKGATKPTTVAKINRTIATGYNASFSLAKATKLLGSSSKVTLTLAVGMRSGTRYVGGVGFRFSYLK